MPPCPRTKGGQGETRDSSMKSIMHRKQEENEEDEHLPRASAETSASLCTRKQRDFMASMERKPGCGDVDVTWFWGSIYPPHRRFDAIQHENGSGNASTLEKPKTVHSLVFHVSLHSGDGRLSILGDRDSGSDCAVVTV